MDEAAINDAMNEQIIALISTPEGLDTLGWFQELSDKAQGVVRTVLFAGLPPHYNEAIEETIALLISLVTGYELLLRSLDTAAAAQQAALLDDLAEHIGA